MPKINNEIVSPSYHKLSSTYCTCISRTYWSHERVDKYLSSSAMFNAKRDKLFDASKQQLKPDGTRFTFATVSSAAEYGLGVLMKHRVYHEWMPSVLIGAVFMKWGIDVDQRTLQEQITVAKAKYKVDTTRAAEALQALEMLEFYKADLGAVREMNFRELKDVYWANVGAMMEQLSRLSTQKNEKIKMSAIVPRHLCPESVQEEYIYDFDATLGRICLVNESSDEDNEPLAKRICK